ncbi:MAG: hypothetical protein H0U73_04870 [Tatlockia sp.]|nr:hypothetical protein [Tatlockia sp.]
MRKISLCLPLAILAGCSTLDGGTMNAPGSPASLVSYTAVNNSRMSSTGVDTRAINAAIAADRGYYWAPEEEVMQQRMSDEI